MDMEGCLKETSVIILFDICKNLTRFLTEASVPHHEALSAGLLERPHDMAAIFPQSEPSKGEHGGSHSVFHDLLSEVALCQVRSILLAPRAVPGDVRDRTGHEHLEAGPLGCPGG